MGALELLRESGEGEKIQRAHALYFLTFVEEAHLHLKGPQQTLWLEQLERERANLRAALAWLIEHQEAEFALRFCGALWWFWYLRGYWSEGRRWLEGAIGLAQAEDSTEARARALYAARSEEHTSELQSHLNLLCRLLLEKKKMYGAIARGITSSFACGGRFT